MIKKILFFTMLSFSTLSSSPIMDTLFKTNPAKANAIIAVSEMDSCGKFPIEKINNEYISVLNEKHQDIILATELVFKSYPKKIKAFSLQMKDNHCSIQKKNISKKQSKINTITKKVEIKAFTPLSVMLLSGIDKSIVSGSHIISFSIKNTNCFALGVTDLKTPSSVKINLLKCSGKPIHASGFLLNKDNLISSFDLSKVNTEYSIILIKDPF